MLAGIMTDFGSRTGPVAFGGRGEFDGVMTGPFRRPRVEGDFSGADLWAWDTLWGDGTRAHRRREQLRGRARTASSVSPARRFTPTACSRSATRATTAARKSTRGSACRGATSIGLRHAFQIDEYPVCGPALGRVPPDGRVSAADGLRRHDHRQRRRRTASRCEKTEASLRFDGIRHPPRRHQHRQGRRRQHHRRGVHRLGLDVFVQRRRPADSGRAHRAAPVSQGAAVGPRRVHGAGQRDVRRAAQRLQDPRERPVRRRGRRRAGERLAGAARQRAERRPRRGVAAARDHRDRAHRADAAGRRRAHVPVPRQLARSRTCGCSSRGCRRSPPPSPAGRFASSASWPTSITCSWTPRSTRSTCACSTTRSRTRRRSGSRSTSST